MVSTLAEEAYHSKDTLLKQSAAATVVDNMSFEEDIDAVVN